MSLSDLPSWILYVVFLGLVAHMYAQARTVRLDALLDLDLRIHLRVHRVLARMPRGGTWRAFRNEMDAEEA